MKEKTFSSIALKTIVVHTMTYFFIGILAFILLDYTTKFTDPIVAGFMRQTDNPLVAGGTIFQILRGFLFGLVFYFLQEIIFDRKYGWMVLWLSLVVMGIISPFGAAPSSIEGIVYSRLPFWFHISGLPEVVLQAFLLAFLTYHWVNNPEKKWIGWVFGVLFVLAILMSTMGLLAGLGIIQAPA